MLTFRSNKSRASVLRSFGGGMVQALLLDQLLPNERDRLNACLWTAARSNRSCAMLAAQVETGKLSACWERELPPDAQLSVLGPEQLVVALPAYHIDKACALAERLVRLHRMEGLRIHIGVAETVPQCAELEPLLGRAEEALRLATEGSVGSVASMHWADVSQDLA